MWSAVRRRLRWWIAALLAMWMGAAYAADESAPAQPAELTVRVGHSFGILRLAFWGDGAFVVSAGGEGTIKLWDFKTGRLIRTMAFDARLWDMAVAPRGGFVLAASADGRLARWDLASGRQMSVQTISPRGTALRGVAISSDERRMVVGAWDGELQVFDLETGRQIARWLTGHGTLTSLAMSPDGTKVVTAGAGGQAEVWDAQTGKSLARLVGHGEAIWRMAFSPDGQRLVSAGGRLNEAPGPVDSKIRVWNVGTAALLQAFGSDQRAVRDVTFSPDGKLIAATSGTFGDRYVNVFDAASGAELQPFGRPGELENSDSLAFSPNGRELVSGIFSAFIAWSTPDRRALRVVGGMDPRSPSRAIAISGDGNLLAYGAYDLLGVWDSRLGAATTLARVSSAVDSLAISPDLRHVAYRTEGGELGVYDRQGRKFLWKLTNTRDTRTFYPGTGLQFSSDGKLLLLRGDDQTLKVFQADSGTRIGLYTGHSHAILSAVILGNGSRILSIDSKGVLREFDVRSGKLKRSLPLGNGSTHVMAATLSTDGSIAALVESGKNLDDDGRSLKSIRIIDCHSGQTLRSADTRDDVQSMALSKDNQWMATGGFFGDTHIRLRSVDSGKVAATLTGHNTEVQQLTFAPQGDRLFSAGADGTVKVWDLVQKDLIVTLITSSNGENLTITPAGFFAGSAHGNDFLSVSKGLDVYSVDQFYSHLYRPDLVEERLTGDPQHRYLEAASTLSLEQILASGPAPELELLQRGTDAAAGTVRVSVKIKDVGGGIGAKVVWRVNGKVQGDVSQQGITQPPRIGASATVTEGLRVDPARENFIEVVAYNHSGLIASLPLRLTVDTFGVAADPRPRLRVLTVGVSKYKMTGFGLEVAANDARRFGEALSQVSAGLFSDIKVVPLYDEEVTRQALESAFFQLGQDVRPTDDFVLFVAGHGRAEAGRWFFMPQDLDFNKNQSIAKDAIGEDTWQRWLAQVVAQNTLIILDTCESAAAAGLVRGDTQRETAMAQLQHSTGRNLIAASRQAAVEGYKGYGVLTYAVLEAFRKVNDSDQERTVTVDELSAHVAGRVPRISREIYGFEQQPFRKLDGNNFPIGMQLLPRVEDDGCPGGENFVVVRSQSLHEQPEQRAPALRTLDAGYRIGAEFKGKWALVCRNGVKLGYVPSESVAKIQ